MEKRERKDKQNQTHVKGRNLVLIKGHRSRSSVSQMLVRLNFERLGGKKSGFDISKQD